MKQYLALMMTLLVVLSVAPAEAKKTQGNERVLAHSDAEVTSALALGCTIVRQTKGMTALDCPANTAQALGMPADIEVFPSDIAINSQIGASTVQTNGYTGAGRKIVVIDSGYDYTNPELSSSYLGGKDFVNNDMDPMDDNGHGSHVAGIITADGIISQAKGVAPATGIIALKVVPAFGGAYYSDIVAAINYAVDGPDGIANTADDFKADAISISLSTTSAPYLFSGTCDNAFPDLYNAIQHARAQNVLVVIAAGNQGTAGVGMPGCISTATTIGAVDAYDNVASFSGRGSAVDMVAPGVNIFSSYSYLLGSQYATMSGTSQSAPVVAGTVALIKQKTPTMSAAQVESTLFSTAKKLSKRIDTNSGNGRVDALAAVGITTSTGGKPGRK